MPTLEANEEKGQPDWVCEKCKKQTRSAENTNRSAENVNMFPCNATCSEETNVYVYVCCKYFACMGVGGGGGRKEGGRVLCSR